MAYINLNRISNLNGRSSEVSRIHSNGNEITNKRYNEYYRWIKTNGLIKSTSISKNTNNSTKKTINHLNSHKPKKPSLNNLSNKQNLNNNLQRSSSA